MAQDSIKDIANAIASAPIEGARLLANEALDLMRDNHFTIATAPLGALAPVGAFIDWYRKSPNEDSLDELDFSDPKLETSLKVKNVENQLADKFACTDTRSMGVNNMDRLVGLVRMLPNGKYDAGLLKPVIDRLAGACLDKESAALIANIDSLEKKGNHFEVNFNRTTTVAMNEKVPGTLGMVSVKNLSMDQLSFDLNSYNGKERLENIQGMKVHYSAPTGGFDGSIKGLNIGRAQDGSIRYEATVTQNSTIARAIGVPGEFKARMKADNSGRLVLTNEKEIESQVQKPIRF